jgi:hypothetical protein
MNLTVVCCAIAALPSMVERLKGHDRFSGRC